MSPVNVPILVSQEALASEDPYDLIGSNIFMVNGLLDRHLDWAEIAVDALRSYYVDYFVSQLHNGGFSQFVYNTRWGAAVEYLEDGLAAMGATRHHAQIEQAAQKMEDRPGVGGLRRFFASDYFNENAEREILNELTGRFLALQDEEDLTQLNSTWLRNHLDRRATAIPDLTARIARARAAEPRYTKIIRALCDEAGFVLDRVTAGFPSNVHSGQPTIAWHFLTDHGHHHMLHVDGKAIMLRGHTDEIVCEMVVGHEYD